MSKRYYLHRCLKKKNYRYSSQKKTVFLGFDEDLKDRHILRLKNEFNYAVQLEIR